MSQNEFAHFVQKLLSESTNQVATSNGQASKGISASQAHFDEKVLMLMRADDTAAVSLLFEKYGDKIYGVLLHLFQDEPAATAAMPELFKEIWTLRRKVEFMERPMLPWLIGLTIRFAVNKKGLGNPNLYGLLYQ